MKTPVDNAFKELPESLYKLLCFIRGSNENPGLGIRTHSGGDRNNERIHQACLELEECGLIFKQRADGDSVLWMPVFPEPATPRNPISLTVTRKSFFGFPLVIDESIPRGQIEMLLEEDERNQTGQIELHGRSFVATPGDTIDLFFRGQVVTTIEFTAGTLFDGPHSEPKIGPELQRFVDSLRETQ